MRIILLANNWVGLQVTDYLKKRKEQIVALGIHESQKQKYTKEIIKCSKVPGKYVFTAHSLRDATFVAKLASWKPDMIIAAFWGYILTPDVIGIPPKGCINFHPGYLPYNRGMNPNVWPFVEGTPAGVTIHYIDPGVDTGDIIARKKVPITPIDTAGSLYDKTLQTIVELFKKEWPKIKSGKNKRIKQKTLGNKVSFHLGRDVSNLDEIVLTKRYTGSELINRLKARSYSNRYFSYFKEKGKKVYIRLQLSYEDD